METNFIELSFDDLIVNLNEILHSSIPVWRKNKSGKFVTIPLDRLEQFVGNDNSNHMLFFIEDLWEARIKKSRPTDDDKKTKNNRKFLNPPPEGLDPYTARRKDVRAMSEKEREKEYDDIVQMINHAYTSQGNLVSETITDIVDAISDAFVVNKTSFEDILDENIETDPVHIKKISRSTTKLVENVLDVLRKKQATNDFINLLGEKSTGSTIDHMNSVFLIYTSFCLFYNSYFKKGKIARIRSEFRKKFIDFYKKIMPSNPPETLEDVFMNGMREIDDEKMLQIGIGAFLHDIGKIDNIDYFEGEGAYDRKIIMRHAPISYNMIVKTREFESEVAMLAALHHEYYNDSSGYSLSKILFPEKSRKNKYPKYCMSYDLSDIKHGTALAYVPAKMLEIVDVFDALTDKKRKYRDKEFSPKDALKLMNDEFIERNQKIDPILFTIFYDFIMSHSINNDSSVS